MSKDEVYDRKMYEYIYASSTSVREVSITFVANFKYIFQSLFNGLCTNKEHDLTI